jgi:metal-sulfur cluster biosynthetic enzyme
MVIPKNRKILEGAMVTHEQILEALKQVIDPELFVNVVDLGLVYKVDIKDEEKVVSVDLGLTSPACPAGPQLVGQAVHSVEALESGFKVEVQVTLDPPWTPDRMSEEARDQLGIF